MLNLPSFGIINPTKKAPKIGCTPIISVMNDEINTNNKARVVTNWVGPPPSKLPVRLANM